MKTPLHGLSQNSSADVHPTLKSELPSVLKTVCSLYEELSELQSQRDILAARLAERKSSERVIVDSFRDFSTAHAVGTTGEFADAVAEEPLETVFARAGFVMRPVKRRGQ
jgi:hypothetical protein